MEKGDTTNRDIEEGNAKSGAQARASSFCAFGDESTAYQWVSYALVGFWADALTAAEAIVSEEKTRFGVNPAERLHCRELFNDQARRKTAFAGLSRDKIIDLYASIALRLRMLGALYAVGLVNRGQAPPKMAIPWATGQIRESRTVRLSDKHLALFAFMGAAGQLNEALTVDSKVRVIIDPDTTLIDWFGKTREQAWRIYGRIHMDIPAQWSQPEIPSSKPALLEIADLAAYVSPRVRSEQSWPGKEDLVMLHSLMGLRHAEFSFADQVRR